MQSRDHHGIAVIRPISRNYQWQAKADEGYDLASFSIDWQKHQPPALKAKRV
ncbi:MAG: hypothetical protein ACYDER_03075 [Ktedonobacteraceae bacterium]